MKNERPGVTNEQLYALLLKILRETQSIKRLASQSGKEMNNDENG